MDYNKLVTFIQGHFSDGLVLVVGSGLSAAEGIPGMPALAQHLQSAASSIESADVCLWSKIEGSLNAGEGLEAALLKFPPSDTLQLWIAARTAELLIPKEREIVGEVFRGERELRLETLLKHVFKPSNGLPIVTPNYDRLIEVACEMAGLHVDTTAIGNYAGAFDHVRSCMASCRAITSRAKTTVLDHFPRAIVLKPHGSLDWYRVGNDARRCSIDIQAERLIITPGLNKYLAGYDSPFDKHRDLANDHIKRASRLLIVGYGFNDDHLQKHLLRRIADGTPTLILNLAVGTATEKLALNSPSCVCLSKPKSSSGVVAMSKASKFERIGLDLWDIGTLAKELLA